MLSNKDPFPRLVVDGGFILPMVGGDLTEKCLLLSGGMSPYVRAIRRIYAKAFQSSNLKAAMPKINGNIQTLIDIIESRRKNGPVEVQKLCACLTLDVIGTVAFDENIGALDGSRNFHDIILDTGNVVRQALLHPLVTIYCKFFPNCKEAKRRRDAIDKMISEWKWLTDEVLKREEPAAGDEPFWHNLRRLVDPKTDKPLSYTSLLAEIATVVVGGMDTTGNQLAWIVALLAYRPDVVDKILEELEQHGIHGPGSRDVQFEDLSALPFLTAVIKEGMRVAHVSSASFARVVPRDMTICGYKVPQGTRIMRIGNRAFSVDVDWSDPSAFDPQRWLRDDELCHKSNMMFSVGPRDCPGQKLAMLEMRLAIIALLQNYKLKLVGTYSELVDQAVTGLATEAKNGIYVEAAPRGIL